MKKAIFTVLSLLICLSWVPMAVADYCECSATAGCWFDWEPISACPSGTMPYPEGEKPEALKNQTAAAAPATSYARKTHEDEAINRRAINKNRSVSQMINRAIGTPIYQAFGARTAKSASGPKTVLDRRNRISGMASGEDPPKFGLWLTPTVSWLEDDTLSGKHDGNLYMIMAGVDYKPIEKILLGVSGGYEYIDLDTAYNGGTFESEGYNVAPYVGLALFDNLYLDIIFSYAWLQNDVVRDKDTGAALSGDYDSERYVISANLNYYANVNNWSLGAVVGYMYVDEDHDAYTQTGASRSQIEEMNTYLGEWRFGVRIGYIFENAEPYLSAAYLYDDTFSGEVDDRDELECALGIDFYPSDTFSCALEASHGFLRDDVSNTRVLVNLRYNF
jgi:outer membrane autotransporter protein